MSFGAFLGDWSRYIPADTPRRKVMGAAFLAQIATLVPFVLRPRHGLDHRHQGARRTSTRPPPTTSAACWPSRPGWYFLPLCLIALIGGMSTGTTSLYGTGLDFSSVFPQFSRVQATLFIGVLSIAFIFVGRFALNLVQSISTFAMLIITCTAPWMVVMMLGFVTRRGWYDADALQVFNRRQRGGRYWFNHGWNWRGLSAWLLSAALGLLFTNIPGQFVGPLGDLAGGVDISLPLSPRRRRGALPGAAVALPRAACRPRPARPVPHPRGRGPGHPDHR